MTTRTRNDENALGRYIPNLRGVGLALLLLVLAWTLVGTPAWPGAARAAAPAIAFDCAPLPSPFSASRAYLAPDVGYEHRGADFVGTHHSIFRAVWGGQVVYVGPMTGLGPEAIVVDHGEGVFTVYGHGKALVPPGEWVGPCQPIGTQDLLGWGSDDDGNVRPVEHLHLEVWKGAAFQPTGTGGTLKGTHINPTSLLPAP